MKTVREMLSEKGSSVWSIPSTATVFEALKMMAERDVGALLVVDDEQIVGIMTERDYARKVAILGRTSKEAPVKEIMSEHVLYVGEDESVEECMALMITKRVRHLPVLKEGKLNGLISIGDVVKGIIDEKEFTIGQLTHYITGHSL
ncbi:MAG: CBS domain-containing protein [Ignavibacteriaceae bacterium]|nr:CBS domain-containing protein [Ignavibacteriaceae bacterium]